jgi:hypothetical protein
LVLTSLVHWHVFHAPLLQFGTNQRPYSHYCLLLLHGNGDTGHVRLNDKKNNYSRHPIDPWAAVTTNGVTQNPDDLAERLSSRILAKHKQ